MPPGAKGRPRFPRIVTKTDEMVAEVPKPQFKRGGPTSLDPYSTEPGPRMTSIFSSGFTKLPHNATFAMASLTEWHAPSIVLGSPSSNTWRRGFADLGYTLKATDRWDMSFNATYTRNTFDNPGYPNIGRDSQEVLLEWTNSITLSNRDRLTMGALFNHAKGQETYFGLDAPIQISNGSRPGGAFYGQWDHQLADSVKLVGGFQVNKIDGTAVSVVPRGLRSGIPPPISASRPFIAELSAPPVLTRRRWIILVCMEPPG